MTTKLLPQIIFASSLLVAGFGCLVIEARALIAGSLPGTDVAATAPLGLALTTRHEALFRCDEAMAEPLFSMQGTIPRETTASYCWVLAQRVLRDAPSDGFAHFIAAASADVTGDADRMTYHLTAAQSYAPYEGWLAERRVLLVARSDPARWDSFLPADIAVLMTTQTGAELLADLLTADLPLRDAILAEAEQASTLDRQRLSHILTRKIGGA